MTAFIPIVEEYRPTTVMLIGHKSADPLSKDLLNIYLALAGLAGTTCERLRNERELNRHRAHLEELVRDRTADVQAAKAALEQANAAKDQFIAALSHELRTPLTPVLAAASSVLKDVRLPEDIREDVEMVHRNVALEVALIDDLLDVTRIAAGKLVLDKRPVDVAQVLRGAASICSVDLDGRSQTLTIETPGEPYPMLADAARLHQVFWNLIKNALKFTPQGGRIGIQASAEENILRVEVRDSGVGIDPEILPKLFNRFEQGHGATTRQFGGLGLGLAIAKAVVEAHAGRITAASEGRNKGSTFSVELPIGNCTLPEPRHVETPPAAEGQLIPPLRILLVEDHADTAKLMARLLAADGHQVTRADCVEAALAAAWCGRFDLLISDLGLPDGTGHDLLRQLAALGKPITAIALSGYGAAADLQKSREAGFVEHLVKPLDFSALHAALVRVGRAQTAQG